MRRKAYANVMVLLCIAYGAIIGILGFAGTKGLTMVAIVGAIILGLGWTGMGMFTKPGK